MLKYLAGLVLVFGLTVYVSIQDERSAQQTTQKSTQSDKGALPAKADENHPQQNVPHPERNAPRWYAVLSPLFRWPEGPTTWVIVLTLLAIAEQARETAKATQAVRDSIPLQREAADAALLNAQALINAERSWVDVVPIHSEEGQWRFEATNHGRTPAEIVSTCCRFEINLIDGLTEPPLYNDRKETYKRFIFPLNKEPVRVGAMPITGMLAATGREDEVRSGAQTFVIIGRVVYYDVLNRIEPPHETRYCYGWSVRDDTLFSMGPSGYHGHT